MHDPHTMPYLGMLDADNMERMWAVVARIAPSLIEMGNGAREDALNEHFNDFNHRKMIDLGMCISHVEVCPNVRFFS